MSYKNTPIFYMGNKYKLLKDIIPLFPKQCDTFVDLFGGSGVVSINYKGRVETIYNEFNENICSLVLMFKNTPYDVLDEYFTNEVLVRNLRPCLKRSYFETEEEFMKDRDRKAKAFYDLRYEYNNSRAKDVRLLWLLSAFSCNHLIRFNQASQFNASFGSNGYYNDTLRQRIKDGCDGLLGVTVINDDAFNFDFSDLTENDFVYLDPPYSNTTAVYNEKRAFGGWGVEQDLKLFKLLDDLTERNIKWGLSNVYVCRGVENTHLKEWCEQRGYTVKHLDRNYNPFSRGNSNNDEVYIYNYEERENE